MYIGVKLIEADPMARETFEAKHGRNVGGDKTGDGYEVTYESGYQAWSPKDVFDAAYRPVTALTFGLAIEALKLGKKVARAGWNGKGMWVAYTPASTFAPQFAKDGHAAKHRAIEAPNEDVRLCAHFDMRAADGSMVIGWLASQTDMQAEDWQVVE